MIAIERLSDAELAALDHGAQCRALNEVMVEMRRVGKAIREAIQSHADARIRALLAGDSGPPQLLADVIGERAKLDILRERLRLYREFKSALQTLINNP